MDSRPCTSASGRRISALRPSIANGTSSGAASTSSRWVTTRRRIGGCRGPSDATFLPALAIRRATNVVRRDHFASEYSEFRRYLIETCIVQTPGTMAASVLINRAYAVRENVEKLVEVAAPF